MLDHLVTSVDGSSTEVPLNRDDRDWYSVSDRLVMSYQDSPVRCVLFEAGYDCNVIITSLSVKKTIDSIMLSNSVRMCVI